MAGSRTSHVTLCATAPPLTVLRVRRMSKTMSMTAREKMMASDDLALRDMLRVWSMPRGNMMTRARTEVSVLRALRGC